MGESDGLEDVGETDGFLVAPKMVGAMDGRDVG